MAKDIIDISSPESRLANFQVSKNTSSPIAASLIAGVLGNSSPLGRLLNASAQQQQVDIRNELARSELQLQAMTAQVDASRLGQVAKSQIDRNVAATNATNTRLPFETANLEKMGELTDARRQAEEANRALRAEQTKTEIATREPRLNVFSAQARKNEEQAKEAEARSAESRNKADKVALENKAEKLNQEAASIYFANGDIRNGLRVLNRKIPESDLNNAIENNPNLGVSIQLLKELGGNPDFLPLVSTLGSQIVDTVNTIDKVSNGLLDPTAQAVETALLDIVGKEGFSGAPLDKNGDLVLSEIGKQELEMTIVTILSDPGNDFEDPLFQDTLLQYTEKFSKLFGITPGKLESKILRFHKERVMRQVRTIENAKRAKENEKLGPVLVPFRGGPPPKNFEQREQARLKAQEPAKPKVFNPNVGRMLSGGN